MKAIASIFLLASGAGFFFSAMAHVVSLCGVALPGGGLVLLLHVGIFAVWIPAILLSKSELRGVPRKLQMDAMMGDCPRWMRRAVTIISVYALVNFALFLLSTIGQSKPTGAPGPSVIRGFSGHWMLFYAVAFTTFYSIVKRPGSSESKTKL